MPVSYLNGKIYSITCLLTDKVYIGCTAQEYLGKRITTHISAFQRWQKNGKNYCSSYEVLKHDSYAIKIVEYVPCTSKQELEERETWYIRNTPNCINKCKKCLLSIKEYQRLYHQAWHQKNKEQQQIYHKLKYQQKKNEKISQCNIDDNEAD
jgi:hypothetical protein